MKLIIIMAFLTLSTIVGFGQEGRERFMMVELNCENLFDCAHDSLKNDYDFCEGGTYKWNFSRYWRKLNAIGRTIVSCGGEGETWAAPDIVALVEVENDSVMTMLTKRSLLNRARYEYIMTDSRDERGVDVALLYNPHVFSLQRHYSLQVKMPEGHRPTRDILYAQGLVGWNEEGLSIAGCEDRKMPLHVFVVHAPSRRGGEAVTRELRLIIAERLCVAIDSIRKTEKDARIIVAGDFNDYHDSPSVMKLADYGMVNVSAKAVGKHGATGTYRYRGEWGSLDHILVSETMMKTFPKTKCEINDKPFLVEREKKYGGVRPRRTYQGPKYDKLGVSDHLPLVLHLF